MIRPTDKQWNDFVRNYLDFESEDTNVRGSFSQISKKAGVPYFEFLKAQWICSREHMTPEQFCRMNGEVPMSFFEKNIFDKDEQFEIIENGSFADKYQSG